MLREDLLLRTRLAPPRLPRRLLPRPALVTRLQAALDYRLTLLQAGAGYGKTTLLAGLAERENTFWYSLGPGDTDPQQFLSYLIGAFRLQLPELSAAPWAILGEISAAGAAVGPHAAGPQWLPVIDSLLNSLAGTLARPALLVLDDFHLAGDTPAIHSLVARLIAYAPADLHVIIATRGSPLASEPSLLRLRARGEVLEFGHADLVFSHQEIRALFSGTNNPALPEAEICALAELTEGWPIALHMLWQSAQRKRGQTPGEIPHVSRLLAQTPESLAALFDFLARDVLAAQPAEWASFLLETAVLREMAPSVCDAVARRRNSATLLARMHDADLFLVALDGPPHHTYRYHHLFHDFLRQAAAADPIAVAERHKRAAAFYRDAGDPSEAVFHWLAAGALEEAAAAIAAAGETLVRAGRLDTLSAWIDALPPSILAEHPALQASLGDIYRLRSRFDEALAWYAASERTSRARGDAAGLGRAMRGQALVYLDTVRPAQAETLLAEALRVTDRLSDREAQARLMDLLAENKLNMGNPAEAEELRGQARRLREEGPGEDVLSVRVRLRTGRLQEAQTILAGWAEQERQAAQHGEAHVPRAHRETVLILSLILSFRGEAGRARKLAEEGIPLGEQLGSPFITAVGHMRLGHALQLADEVEPAQRREEALRCYQTSIALGDSIAVRRIRAEAMWGLTRAYGFFGQPGAAGGDLAAAQRAAAEGIETGRWAGDPWIVALIEIALGGSHVLAGRAEEGLDALARALLGFRECGDTFGRAAARLWLALAYLDLRQWEHFTAQVEDLLALCEAHGYDFLFTEPSLLSPPDPRRLAPVLIQARKRGHRPTYIARLLTTAGLGDLEVHPGYQLRVQMLGGFRVWRGHVEVAAREWQRDKARQLFQLLLIRRGRWLQRDEIVERLWPDLAPAAAARDFKVALNALNHAVEPAHLPDAPFAFVVRDGTAYAFRPDADVSCDAWTFERESEAGLLAATAGPDDVSRLSTALGLYAGDYLPDALYEDWAAVERERLLALYLRAADRLAGALLEMGYYDQALDSCNQILSRDPCWERAYRTAMLAYMHLGNRPQAIRTFQRCVSALRTELAVGPSAQTVALYREIAQETTSS